MKLLLAYLLVVPGLAGAPPVKADLADDSTAALQAKFDQLQPGASVTLDPGTYRHGGVLQIRVPGVRIDGNGATLQATNDETSSVQIRADGVTLENLNLTAPLGGPRYSGIDQHKLVVAANGVTLRDVTITGSAAAGVFVDGASNFELDRVTVRDSRADGIHMTHGANNGRVNNPTTERTGDDGVAVVSYSEAYFGDHSPPCRDIVIDSPVVKGTTWGRGIAVGGGENISYRNINVSETSGAGVYIVSDGDPFYTQSVNGVDVTGGSVTMANVNPAEVMAPIAVYASHAGFGVSNVTFADLVVSNTPASARRNIGMLADKGGFVDNISFRNIAVSGTDLPVFETNVPRNSYATSGFTLNGAPFTVE